MLKTNNIRLSRSLCANNGHNVEFLSTKSVIDTYQPEPGMQKHRD